MNESVTRAQVSTLDQEGRPPARRMLKVVYAARGPFRISAEALAMYHRLSLTQTKSRIRDGSDIEPDDPVLVYVVETLRERANGLNGQLAITKVPVGARYTIQMKEGGGEEVLLESDFEWRVA